MDLLLDTGTGRRIGRRLAAADEELVAPHLLDLEVAQVLRRYVRAEIVPEARARAALRDLADLPLRRHRHDLLLPAVWALRENATAYDAAYLVLAEALEATLLTCDSRMTAVPGVEVEVEVL